MNELPPKDGVTAIPRYVLLDPSGKSMRQWLGTTSQGDFEAALGKICAAK